MYSHSFVLVLGLCLASGAVPGQPEGQRAAGGCVLPDVPEHGSYSVSTQALPAPGQTFNVFVLTVACKPGYAVGGSGTTYCISDNRWLQPMPQCRPVPTTPTCNCTATSGNAVLPEAACPAIAPELTTNTTGSKAWNKCLEYQEQLIYPCEENTTLKEGKHRSNRCTHNNTLVVGRQAAQRNEFPHLVWLCKGQPNDTSRDLRCLGAIVSDRFILLRAAYVRQVNDFGEYYAIVGALHPDENITDSQAYRLKRAYKHPQYDSATEYNNIALVETVDQIRLGPAVVPACLDVFGGDHSAAVVTDWRYTDRTLEKPVTKATDAACRERHPPGKYSALPRGVDATQGCYTPDELTCLYGASLIVENHRVNCMHTLVALPFGWGCFAAGEPRLFTAVASYVSWIEGIVWP